MLRFVAGVVSALLLVGAGFFFWTSWAQQEQPVPPAPVQGPFVEQRPPIDMPPAAPEKSKEEKRFARADRDDDGRITREEMLEPRRKPFAKLDTNSDGRLSFEEWATRTVTKFDGADADKDGALTPAEFETTKPKPVQRKCAC